MSILSCIWIIFHILIIISIGDFLLSKNSSFFTQLLPFFLTIFFKDFNESLHNFGRWKKNEDSSKRNFISQEIKEMIKILKRDITLSICLCKRKLSFWLSCGDIVEKHSLFVDDRIIFQLINEWNSESCPPEIKVSQCPWCDNERSRRVWFQSFKS